MTKNHIGQKRILTPSDVYTINDVDVYRNQHPINGQVLSRYKTMVNLYGSRQADIMMRELEVKSW